MELDNLPGHSDRSCKASAWLPGKGFAGDRCWGAPKVPLWQEDGAWLQRGSSEDTGIAYQPLHLNMLSLTLLATQLSPGNICLEAQRRGCG